MYFSLLIIVWYFALSDFKILNQSFILGISFALLWCIILCCSVTKSCPTLCDSMNFIQHGRLSCPSWSLGVCWNSLLLSWWCYLTISFSAVPFFSCPQSFPASGSFQMSQLFISGDQSIGASVSASILLMSIQDWFPLGLTGCISCPRDPQESSPTPQFKSINSSAFSLLYGPTVTSIHDYWKNHSLTRWILVGKAMSLLLNMLSRLVITFLQRSKLLLISWLQSPSAMILEPPPKKKSPFPLFLQIFAKKWWDWMLWMLRLKASLFTLISPSSRGSLGPLWFLT